MRETSLREVSFASRAVQQLLREWNQELGFTPKGGSTVEVDDFASPNGIFLILYHDGGPAACGGLRRLDRDTGEIKRLFVRPDSRRIGAARQLLDALEHHAVKLGLHAVRLDTAGQASAQALFHSAGYIEIPDYNSNPYARCWFEKRLETTEPNTT